MVIEASLAVASLIEKVYLEEDGFIKLFIVFRPDRILFMGIIEIFI
jgi:hypothetical protein